MNAGIGKDTTRKDHKGVSDQCYAGYAEGKDLRGLVAIVGKEALSERDVKFLEFVDSRHRSCGEDVPAGASKCSRTNSSAKARTRTAPSKRRSTSARTEVRARTCPQARPDVEPPRPHPDDAAHAPDREPHFARARVNRHVRKLIDEFYPKEATEKHAVAAAAAAKK